MKTIDKFNLDVEEVKDAIYEGDIDSYFIVVQKDSENLIFNYCGDKELVSTVDLILLQMKIELIQSIHNEKDN